MAKGSDIPSFLRPEGGWSQVGDDYEGITFHNCEPFTRQEFDAAFDKYDAWKAQQDAERLAKKAAAEAKLTALGLTTDDLKALGLGQTL